MSKSVDLGFAFSLPPKEAIEYFENRGYRVTDNALEAYLAIKERAYTIAGVLRDDILKDTKDGIRKALANGTTFNEFKTHVEDMLAKRGYVMSGRMAVDENGEVAAKHLAPYRLKTVFRTNLQSAYMAGRYKQMQADVEFAPYWQYLAVMDSRTRPSHRAAHGMVFRHDDPFWNSHFPPCDFNCRCTVRSLRERDLGRFGLEVSDSEGMLEDTQQEIGKTGVKIPTKTFKKNKLSTPFTPRVGFGTRPEGSTFAQPRMLNKIDEQRVYDYVGKTVLADAQKTLARGQAFIKQYALDKVEATAIATYTDKPYEALNERLRTGVATDEDIVFTLTLNRALDKLPNYAENSGISYRNIKDVEHFSDFDRYQVGAVVTEGFFTSTSKITKPQGFKKGLVRFIIKGRRGKVIEELSKYPKQKEVLFKSGTRFKVKSRQIIGDVLEIYLVEER